MNMRLRYKPQFLLGFFAIITFCSLNANTKAAPCASDTNSDRGCHNNKWMEIVNLLKLEGFPNPWKYENETSNNFLQSVREAINAENDMHFQKDSLISYIKYGNQCLVKGQGIMQYELSNKALIPKKVDTIRNVTEKLMSHLFADMVNVYHPLFVPNALPPPTIASLIAAYIGLKVNPNILENDYSFNVVKAEIEVYSMISNLLRSKNDEWPIPWAPGNTKDTSGVPDSRNRSGGIFTFGGTGCYFYAIKYALTHVSNSVLDQNQTTRADGFDRNKFVFLVSNQGHYCSSTVADWSGLGYNSVIKVTTNKDNTMNLNDLKSKLNKCKADKKIVIAVACTFGTTDAAALDDVAGIREILNNFDNIRDPLTKKQYAKPMLYADSVIGWIWLLFKDYDYKQNPLNFAREILVQIEQKAKKSAGLAASDAFAIDFHKTGYSSVPSSMVMFKDYGHYAKLLEKQVPAYLPETKYEPFLYTLETSRPSAISVQPWAVLHYLGMDGLRSLSYNLLEKQNYFRTKLDKTGFIIVCNKDNHFYVTLFRVYPYNYSRAMYERELQNETLYNTVFKPVNNFQKLLFNRLSHQYKVNDGSPDSLSTPLFSLISGFRGTYYNEEGDKNESYSNQPMQKIFAIKCYINTPFIEDKYVDIMVDHIIKARNHLLNYNQTSNTR